MMKISALFLSVAIAMAQDAAVETSVPIQLATMMSSGSGCSRGIPVSLDTVNSKLRYEFLTGLSATLGGPQNKRQSNCQIHMDIRYAQEYQVSVRVANVTGSATLEEGVEGQFMVQTYFSQAASKTVSQKLAFLGSLSLSLSLSLLFP
jgi:hypothetical protein